jgi:S-adenosylmethionine:tRNA ribosyltransferase-isomerase
VGLGTFRPVKTETVEAHQMHTEYFQISTELAAAIAATKASGQRVIAVGTTSVRALETMGRADGTVQAGEGQTAIFIYPGYQFKVLDGLITNFHLPRSTLLMLVSAFAGRELTLAAYEEAIKERYRFFSFGDAMLLL